MRSSLRSLAFSLALLPVVAPAQRTPRAAPVTQAEVDQVTHDVILIDTHNDVPSRTVDGFNIAEHNPHGQTDLPTMRGVLGAEFFAAYVGAEYVPGNHSAHRALAMIDTIRTDIVARHPADFTLATTADQIEQAHRDGRIAALIGIEGGHAIEDSLRLLRDFYALGVRYMTLTHFNTNSWADAQGDINDPRVHHHNGLTPFGKDVVREMNRLGMMVDISHTADKTFWDALATSQAPLIASHSSCRAISAHTRNLTDAMIRALAAKGGTVQINFDCGYLSQRYSDAARAAKMRYKAQLAEAEKIADPVAREKATDAIEDQATAHIPPATLDDVLRTIDHAVEVGGIDHVGIGTDFDGVGCVPAELRSYSDFPKLTRALLQRGYTADDIRKIYGGNLLRVMRAVAAEGAREQAAGTLPPAQNEPPNS